MFRIFYLILFVLILLTCKGESPGLDLSKSEKRSATASAPMPESAGYADTKKVDDLNAKDQRFSGEEETQDKVKPFVSPKIGDLKIGRLLEYRADLTFTAENFLNSRKFLLELSSKYGFVQNESFHLSDGIGSSGMSATFHVRSADLYKVLLELDKLGSLISEHIEVEDHTEVFALEQIHARREKIRTARRSELVSRSPAKTAVDAEVLLGESEDAADSAEFEKWKILDRVAWAKITIHVQGPKAATQVEVPNFRDAFIDLISLSLKLVLFAVYAIPFALFAGVLVFAFLYIRKRWFK